ncbi:hypothetical protein KZP17_09260 [Bifidobacterium pseudocatenulatum]|uniref:hypothetical protein n=1 Tax=Bifidobacterium pseudocatenulatum TaxID=28026 RepID=UPI001CFD52D0|nr:hypothetical protein [Bifidobacterium pseudocatenulatum]MCB4902589.1 hypothetical protein [Bifidobacterium pseudocatenulatum]
MSDERSQVSLLLILLSILSLSAMVHYTRLSLGRMSRMPDEESRSDLFNYRLMTVISLLVLTVSVVAIIAYNKSFYQ